MEPSARPRSELLVVGGGVVFVLGILALLATVVVWQTGGTPPNPLISAALLCPLGFAIGLAGLVVAARERRGD